MVASCLTVRHCQRPTFTLIDRTSHPSTGYPTLHYSLTNLLNTYNVAHVAWTVGRPDMPIPHTHGSSSKPTITMIQLDFPNPNPVFGP